MPTIIEHCLQHSTHGVSHYVCNTLCSHTSCNSQRAAQHSAHYILHYLNTLCSTHLTRRRAASRASQLTVLSYDTESSTSSSNYNIPMQFNMYVLLTHQEPQYHDKVQPPPHLHPLHIHSALKLYSLPVKLLTNIILLRLEVVCECRGWVTMLCAWRRDFADSTPSSSNLMTMWMTLCYS